VSALPIVLIPGFMCDARVFSPQIGTLSHRNAVHVANITDQDSIENLARAILVSAPLRFSLAGLSMGGIVALAMILQAPERIRRLSLISTDARADSPKAVARRAQQVARVEAGQLRAVMRDEVLPDYLADDQQGSDIGALCLDMALGLGAEVFLRQSAALRDRPDLSETLERCPVPTLVLCGEMDALCPPERNQSLHELAGGSRLEVISGAGHLPTLDQPAVTTAALESWLAD
jgi:pimeloyl-ACP methyl ester carboxylesterase